MFIATIVNKGVCIMRPTGIYGTAEGIILVSGVFSDDGPDQFEASLRALENDPRMKRLRLLASRYHLREIGAILYPASGCNPAAIRLVSEGTLTRLEAEFRAKHHLPPES